MNSPTLKFRFQFCALAMLFGWLASAQASTKIPTTLANITPAASTTIGKPLMSTLPLFYQSLAAFNQEQHGKLSFPAPAPNYSFAAQTNIVPLLVNEVSQAVRHYPLVFVPAGKDEPLVFAAMVGLGDSVNRFIGADKQWRADTYIPAYVRQYPFLAVNTPDGKEMVLGIDTSADWINTTGPMAFIGADGKPTARLEQTLAFVQEFQVFAQRTRAMAQALQDAGVLEEGTLTLQANDQPPGQPPAEPRKVSGFVIVSETKLNALSDEAVLKLHKSGAMGLAYAQLLSMSNLGNVMATPAPVAAKAEPVAAKAEPVADKAEKATSKKKK